MKQYSTKEKLMLAVRYAFYAIFMIGLFIYAVSKNNSLEKWLLVVFGLIALAISFLSDYLKHNYHLALYELNFRLNPDEATAIFDKFQKYDIFKSYKKQRIVFDVQVAIEKGRANEALALLEANDKYFRSTLETLTILYYYQLRAYLQLDKHNKIKALYAKILKLRAYKKAPKIFSNEEIDGMYHLGCNARDKAYRSFQQVNMKYMNPKERVFVLKNLYLLSNDDKKAIYKEEYDKLTGRQYEGQ